MGPERNLDGLKRAARERTVGAEETAAKAIVNLQQRGAPVNFATIAAEAGCSRTYLYSHPELRERIRKARGIKSSMTTVGAVRTESSKDRIIETMRSKIDRLESDLTTARVETKRIRSSLERALGDAQYWKEQAKQTAQSSR